MHIPDGFLSPAVSAAAYVISGGTLAAGIRSRLKKRLEQDKIPLMGVMAAFVFAAQMVNFPIIGGTSGHLIGAVLCAAIFGPWTAAIIMTTILAVQCFIFGDGGVTALGANVLNMGILAVFAGYFIYKLFYKIQNRVSYASLFISSWFSVVLSAVLASIEISVSGLNSAAFIEIVKLMVYWHMLIGIGEGIITVLIVKYLKRIKPDLFEYEKV